MATLADIRKQYPQYNDLSDEQLVQGFHKKFYADMPFEMFAAKVGYQAKGVSSSRMKATQQAFTAQAPERKGLLGNFTDQIANNLGVGDELEGAGAYLVQGARNIGRSLTGQPIEVSAQDAGQAAADVRTYQAQDYAKRRPGLNALATVSGIAAAGVPKTAGGLSITSPLKPGYWKQTVPMAAAPVQRMTVLGAAGTNAAIQAPYAVARQEGTLQERLPGAVKETAIAAAAGGAFQGGFNALTRVPTGAPKRLTSSGDNALLFDRAGVRPTYAALAGNETGGMAKAISENWLLGGSARRNMQNSLLDTQQRVGEVAGRYGQVRTPQIVGDEVADAVTKFKNNAKDPRSFKARSEANYNRAYGKIDNSNLAGVSTAATLKLLDEVRGRVGAPNVSELVTNPRFAEIAKALRADEGKISFTDLRNLRTRIRTMQDDPALVGNIDAGDLQRLEKALTEDIMSSARQIGGAAAERALRRADQFYKTGTTRLQQLDKRFAISNPNASAENLYQRIKGVASSGAQADVDSLVKLRQSVPKEVWGDVSATLIDDMGKPTSAALGGDGAFSVTQFAKNYGAAGQRGGMSEAAKDALFGPKGSELRDALDDLAEVARLQGGVEKAANASRSGVSVQNVGTLSGVAAVGSQALAGNIFPAIGVAGGAAGIIITGEMLTNPAFVRWLAAAPKASGALGGWQAHLAQLGQLAARDPALVEYYSALVPDAPVPGAGQQQQPQIQP